MTYNSFWGAIPIIRNFNEFIKHIKYDNSFGPEVIIPKGIDTNLDSINILQYDTYSPKFLHQIVRTPIYNDIILESFKKIVISKKPDVFKTDFDEETLNALITQCAINNIKYVSCFYFNISKYQKFVLLINPETLVFYKTEPEPMMDRAAYKISGSLVATEPFFLCKYENDLLEQSFYAQRGYRHNVVIERIISSV